MTDRKDPSGFLRRLQSTAISEDMEICPMATSILLIQYAECLVENPQN